MTPFEAEMIAVAKELLTEFGFTITITTDASTYNPATLVATPAGGSPVAGLACFFDPSNSKMTGYEQSLPEDIIRGKWMYVQTDGVLKTGCVINYGSRKFKVENVTEIGPSGQVIIYKVASKEVT